MEHGICFSSAPPTWLVRAVDVLRFSVLNKVRTKQSEIEAALRQHTISKKKGFSGTMKPMSAHDEKTLDTAVALANEITSRSMNDLESGQKPQTSTYERSKFQFKFPLVSSLHHVTHHDTDKEAAEKAERRNFSEEANSVPDIQATLTKECKQAYESLIEKPTPSSSLISQISQDLPNSVPKTDTKLSTIPKPAQRQNVGQFHSLQKQIPYQANSKSLAVELSEALSKEEADNVNPIPLPPRGNKPKLVDKPRHFRKYPLKLPSEAVQIEKSPAISPPQEKPPSAIYQNTVSCAILLNKVEVRTSEHIVPAVNAGADVFDGPEPVKVHTNPFTAGPNSDNVPGPSSVNPFKCYLEEDDDFDQISSEDETEEKGSAAAKDFEKVSLTKDHVSVEDLLEFADQKPSAKQRGVESDEVRIMNKVLKQQVTPEECLQALEFSNWNVHIAIKLLRVKISVGDAATVTFEECRRELETADGDIVKASTVLVLCNKNNEEYPTVSLFTDESIMGE